MSETAAPVTPPRRRRWLRALALSVLALLLVIIGGVGWLLGSASGLRFALARAQDFTHGALSVQQAQGRLIGPLRLTGLRYADGHGTEVKLASAQLDLRIWPLLHRRLHVLNLAVDGVTIALPAPQPTPDQSASTFSLKPPLALVLDRVRIGKLSVRQGGQPLFASDSLELAGSWTDSGLSLKRLALRAPDGRADLDGQLAIGDGYRGDGKAAFAWTIDRLDYAGSVSAHSDGANAHIEVALSAPTALQLTLDLSQHGDYAWRAKLDAPRFDPKPLLGESALSSLGATLNGHGDRYQATVQGELRLNDYELRLAPLVAHLDHDYRQLTIDRLTLTSPQVQGNVQASGTVQLDAAPLRADLTLAWDKLQLPPELVGQPLASHGQLSLRGSAEQFHAEGDVALGPPGKLAQLALALDGTPRQISLNRLTLKQAQGQFNAQGTLTLQPSFGWQLDASARRFDPGPLFAGWDGALDLALNTHGSLPATGPDVYLTLDKLDGTLRRRKLSGNGKLHLSPSRVLDGTLALRSASSSIAVQATPGARNDIDLTLAIASLGDWLPDAGGRLNGNFRVRGVLPKLSVSGKLQGSALAYQNQRLQQLSLDAEVPDISNPGGKLSLDARGMQAGALTFNHIALDGEGSAAAHRLRLTAQGQPLSAELALSGTLKGERWSGTLSMLNLDLAGLPRWRLQQSTTLSYERGAITLSELCLSAGDPLLCVAARQDAAGNLDASYRLQALPLALLVNAAGSGDLPMRAEGDLQGNGTLRRNAAGALSGTASLSSARGSITYNQHPDRPLLAYSDLAINANLSPSSQQASVRAQLNDGGRLDGQINLSGAQQALSGQLDIDLNSLAFIELFSAEIANLKGQAQGQFRFGGTLENPQVLGQLNLNGLAAEVPSAGLKLDQGRIVVSTRDAQTFRIDGQLRSGQGQLAINGNAGLGAGSQSEITISGSRFTAADIPAARVVISPQLSLRQNAKGIDLSGSVQLDSADIDISKLPGAGAIKASPDVVIVDEKQQEQAREQLPISATVKLDLGNKTHLVGMGLDGRLRGLLTIIERPGRATAGQGQISVDGTYKAYGQNLSIETGQLLFASTPIDNPGLNIRAIRKLNPTSTIDDGQKVGLYVSGTAQRPVLTVFSEPVMEQSDALSYLVTGKPLSQVRGGEGDMVGAAAQALGSAAGNLLAKSIGSRLGVDDIGVTSNEALGGSSAFTVGKYLSP
ncbi:MAG: translocation/assembly module TamB domain-containing protein, partial [Dyella sp.]